MWSPPPSVTRAPRGLVLSKLCQPCNDPQQSTVSLLIRRPSPWPPPLPAFGIPPPHHLFDPPFPHVPPPPIGPAIRPSVVLSPALRPVGQRGRLVSPPLETAYQGPHVICLQDLTDRSTSEITATIRGGGGGRGWLSALPKWMLLSLTMTLVGNCILL